MSQSLDALPKPLRKLSRLLDVVIALCGAGVVIIVFGNAFLRFVANYDVAGARELATFLMVWVTFLGLATAEARGVHMCVTEIAAYLFSAKARRWLDIGINAAIAVVLVMIIWFGIKISIRTWDQDSTILYWPVGLLYAAMPAGVFLTLIFLAGHTIRLIVSTDPYAHEKE
jgi:TRAP-type C4-dicarboxylate transport system permease small subunit